MPIIGMISLKSLVMTQDQKDQKLLLAIIDADLKMLQKAIEVGADVNRVYNTSDREIPMIGNRQKWGQALWTPLDLAILMGNLKIVRFLVAKGAAVNRLGNRSALITAILYKQAEIACFFMNHHKQPIADVCEAIMCIDKSQQHLLNKLLEHDYTVDMRDENDYQTPLHYAAYLKEAGDEWLVRALFMNGANINAADKNGDTPLHIATLFGCPTVVQTLIGLGADIHAKNKQNKTPRQLAQENKKSKIVAVFEALQEELLQSIIAKDSDRVHKAIKTADVAKIYKTCKRKFPEYQSYNLPTWTPLDAAIYTGNKDVVQTLISAGAPLINRGYTSLDCALAFRQDEIADLLMPNIDLTSEHGFNAINNTHSRRMLNLAFLHGASAHTRDQYGRTPLHYVAMNNNSTWIIRELVIKRNANINATDQLGNTPLHIAAELGAFKVTSMLIKLGADIEIKNNNGDTSRELAKRKNKQEIIAIFDEFADTQERVIQALCAGNSSELSAALKTHESINVVYNSRIRRMPGLQKIDWIPETWTPLDAAILTGNTELVETCIAQGAKIHESKTYYSAGEKMHSRSSLDIALKSGHDEIAKLLLRLKKLTGGYGCRAISFVQKSNMLTELLEAGCSIHMRDTDHWTPLHYAATFNNRWLIQELVTNHGAGTLVNARDNNLCTPLHLAIAHYNLPAVHTLLELGADMYYCNAEQQTAMQMAKTKNYQEIVNILKNEELLRAIVAQRIDLIHRALEKGADLNKPYKSSEREIPKKKCSKKWPYRQWTLLDAAIMTGNEAVVETLINYQAPLFDKISNKSCLDVALFYEKNEIATYFINNMKLKRNPHYGCQALAHAQSLEMLTKLFIAGCTVNMRGFADQTPLHCAAKIANNGAVIRELIKKNAHINAKDMHEKTPLFIASYYGNPENVRILLELGADMIISDIKGNKPRHVASLSDPRQTNKQAIEAIFDEFEYKSKIE